MLPTTDVHSSPTREIVRTLIHTFVHYLSLKLPRLFLSFEGDESVAFGAAPAVADDLGGLDVAEGGEQFVEVGFGGRGADPADEDPVRHQSPAGVLGQRTAAAVTQVAVVVAAAGISLLLLLLLRRLERDSHRCGHRDLMVIDGGRRRGGRLLLRLLVLRLRPVIRTVH